MKMSKLSIVLVSFCLAGIWVVPAGALVMHYDFNGTDNGWVEDSGGEGQNTNLQQNGGATKIASGAVVPVPGSAGRFNASGGYNAYRMPFESWNHYNLDGPNGTIAAWVKITGDHSLPSTITWDGAMGWLSRRTFRITEGKLSFGDCTDSGWKWNTSTVQAIGEEDVGWHHVAVTWVYAGDVKYYLDGELIETQTANIWNTLLYFDRLAIGHDPVNAGWIGCPFQGDIDEVYINYGEAKDAAFIQGLAPEPASMLLVIFGAVALMKRRLV